MSPTATLVRTTGFTTRDTAAAIVDVWHRANDDAHRQGAEWYPSASAWVTDLADRSGYSRETVAAVVAALSPRCLWDANVTAAETLLMEGTDPVGILSESVTRARRAMSAPDPLAYLDSLPSAPKVRAFARNLLGDTDAVTVDTWAQVVAWGAPDHNALRRKGTYDGVAHAYRVAARYLGTEPRTVQAVTWVAVRDGLLD